MMIQGWIKNALEFGVTMACDSRALDQDRFEKAVRFLSENPEATYDDFLDQEEPTCNL